MSIATDEPPAPATTRGDRVRRTIRRTDKIVLVCFALVAAVAVLGLLAPWLAPYSPQDQMLRSALEPPGTSGADGLHLLGTDALGRDILSRLLYGIRPLGTIVVIAVTAAASFGFVYALIAGFTKGQIGNVMMRLGDIQLSIPPVILAIVLAVSMEAGVRSVVIAIALVTWPEYARVVRSEVLRVRTSEYVQLARVAGLNRRRLLRHHVVPNVLNTFVVLCTLNLSIAIIFASALSFLGLGVQAPTPDWGNMLADGTAHIRTSWWMVMVPGIAITTMVLALNIIGDHLRDVMDPRMAKLGAGHGA